jgi:hypothetical protein
MKELSETMSTNEIQEIHNNLVWKFDGRNYYPKSIYRSPSLAVIRDATAAYQFIAGLDFKRDIPRIKKEYEKICNVIQFTNIVHSIPIISSMNPPKKSGLQRPEYTCDSTYLRIREMLGNPVVENKLEYTNATMKFRFSTEYVEGDVYLYLFYIGDGSELLPVEKGKFHKLDDRFTIFGASLCNEIEAWIGKDKFIQGWLDNKFSNANTSSDRGFFQKLFDIIKYDRVIDKNEAKEDYIDAIKFYASSLNDKVPLLSIVKPLVDEYIYDSLDDASKKELSKWTMGICIDYRPEYTI